MNPFPPHPERAERVAFLKTLRDTIVAAFEALESSLLLPTTGAPPPARFERKGWTYARGTGGGEISILRGQVFEKAAVNWSGVSGLHFPMKDSQGPFFATGVSLITHMANPLAPTVHFNIRWIETPERSWFAGGFDLTPMGFPFAEDTAHFHQVAKEAVFPFSETLLPYALTLRPGCSSLYQCLADWAREYFTIRHYQRERGVGGLFFDHWNSGHFQEDLGLWESIGTHFLSAILPLYHKRITLPFTERDRQLQLQRRAHYVEFNLLYDRGTQFGFQSGGNPEAILCSMPPLAAW